MPTKTVLTPVQLLLVNNGLNFIEAVLILIAGWIIATWASRFVRYTLRHIPHFDYTLRPLLASVVRYAILAFTIIAVLQRFGVETTSLIAVVGAAGLAVGLALQGTLSNVASGVMLLVLRPFERGEVIEVAGAATGKVNVREIGLFRTLVATRDNIQLSIPNSSIFSGTITNYSREQTVRINFEVPVDRINDIAKAQAVVVEALKSDPRVLKTPEPVSGVKSLEEYTAVLLARFWVNNADQYRAPYDLKGVVNDALHAAGILLPVTRQAVAERAEGAAGSEKLPPSVVASSAAPSD
ncbi:MAG TPA: mechanosensitive ion channel domain-containing protein [Rhizomicrobium sp.]|jgi:small conductance mechanosensitive channel|nr:mechanosensitive ion channel domain-containing protein [Rhizomicrobium sp.]